MLMWYNTHEGGVVMRKILDKLFENKKLSFIIPILASTLMYLLFVIFGKSENKNDYIISTPIGCIFWFFGVFLVIYIQVVNPRCPEWFLNLFELLSLIIFCTFSVVEAISFITNGFQNFNPLICAGLITYASVAWAHSKRT